MLTKTQENWFCLILKPLLNPGLKIQLDSQKGRDLCLKEIKGVGLKNIREEKIKKTQKPPKLNPKHPKKEEFK